MTRPGTALCCGDVDLDALAYGELSVAEERLVRGHLVLCRPCKAAHEVLLSERRGFVARARRGEPAALPDFDALLARAESEPVELRTRWLLALRDWSSPWRGAVLQGVVGVFAIGVLLQVALPQRPRASEGGRARQSAVDVEGGASLSLDPWGESLAAEADCNAEAQACVDVDVRSNVERALALSGPHSAPAQSDPCAGAQTQPTFATVDWSLQSSSGLDSDVEAVCAPDAI